MATVSRASFPEPLRSVLVTTQPGIAAFWHAVLSMPASFPDRRFVVAELDGRLVGMAEFRTGEGRVHLSHICVDESARGIGVATRLMVWFAEGLEPRTTFDLNVFDQNAAAISLYRSLGFTEEGSVDWFLTPLPEISDAGPEDLRVDNALEQAAWFGAFGFCEVTGSRADQRQFHVGRVGDGVLRLFDPADVEDDRLLAGLRTLFPSAHSSLVRSEPGTLGGGHVPFSSSRRMVAPELRRRR